MDKLLIAAAKNSKTTPFAAITRVKNFLSRRCTKKLNKSRKPQYAACRRIAMALGRNSWPSHKCTRSRVAYAIFFDKLCGVSYQITSSNFHQINFLLKLIQKTNLKIFYFN